jgi:hypothetical protein
MEVCKTYHYAFVEAVKPFKLHPTSLAYISRMFEHLQLLCMGIWLHAHTFTTTDASPDLEDLAENMGNESVQTMPLRYS